MEFYRDRYFWARSALVKSCNQHPDGLRADTGSAFVVADMLRGFQASRSAERTAAQHLAPMLTIGYQNHHFPRFS